MRNRPDKALLERVKRFEPAALEEVFDRYSQGIYRYAFRLLGDTELARECMSETFNRFLDAIQRESGPRDYLQAYLYRIAHNWITDLYRSKVPPSLPLDVELQADESAEPQQAVAGRMASEQLREALALLTPDQRQVIVLKYLEEWETDAIARVLSKPVGAVKALQHRGLETLRRIMRRDEDISV
jgi:RNA polymerase sigma-70 factor (ECF subfamily)